MIKNIKGKALNPLVKNFAEQTTSAVRFSISSSYFMFSGTVSTRLTTRFPGEVSERALREIYLKPFQIAIKNADPWALMSAYDSATFQVSLSFDDTLCSYNRVNGIHVSESRRLLDDILRKVRNLFLTLVSPLNKHTYTGVGVQG